MGCENNEEVKEDNIILWNDCTNSEMNTFKASKKILNLKIRKDKYIFVCQNKIMVYNSKTLERLHKIITYDNPKGLIGINYDTHKTILAYLTPGDEHKVTIADISTDIKKDKKEITIQPHTHKISYILLSYNGLLLATASEQGKKIRIFETHEGNLVQELNRGSDIAEIKCMAIDLKNQFIAASSDNYKIEVWSLRTAVKAIKDAKKIQIEEEESKIENSGPGIFSRMVGAKGESSFITIELKEPFYSFDFKDEQNIIVIKENGTFCDCEIDLEKKILRSIKVKNKEENIIQ